MILYCCVLKGRTTTDEQFLRFLKSFAKAIDNSENSVNFGLYFFIDNPKLVDTVKEYFNERCENLTILNRDDDPGELRNEFLARMQIIEGVSGEKEYFTFFDGDDEISEEYFCQNYEEIDGRGFAIGNPIAVYGNSETDHYPLKWCLVAANEDIYHATLMDTKGCQSWGNVYEMEVAKIAKFGRGLFEDVTFMYSVAQKYRNPVLFWKMCYYWHRDNPIALTRTTSTVSQIRDGMDNLDRAKKIALKDYKNSDPEVYRRYTIGVLILLRNSANVIDPVERNSCREYILSRLDPLSYYFTEIAESEPKFIEKLLESFPNFYEWQSRHILNCPNEKPSEDC